MRKILKILIQVLSILYPVLIFFLLVVYKAQIKVLSLFVIAIGLLYFLSMSNKGKSKLDLRSLIMSFVFIAVGVICYFSNNALFLKFYPVAVFISFLYTFGITLFTPPNIIYRFATMQDKTIKTSVNRNLVEKYCYKVTIAWCLYFIFGCLMALYTVFFCSYKFWSIWNGGVSYILMGLMFVVEFIIRKGVNKRMPVLHTITNFKSDSRKDDYIICFDDVWSKGIYKTWKDFLTDCAKMRSFISTKDSPEWILHCNDYYLFLVTFVALLQCKKEVMLTANISPAFIAEMRNEKTMFLTDASGVENSFDIPTVIANAKTPDESEIRNTPAINADETKIHMFTSGSTGKPKDVLQRMTEFEADNEFVFSQWGSEFLKRKNVATVSQHHIYGFLFTIALPFAAGVPFRRQRVELPTEFEKLSDEEYMIIAVPAFLKRTVEVETKLPLRNPFIFTSGGVLLPEVAKKTNDVFGFWPVEVYGSTETSGIAHRQSKNGLEWTPFANATIWVDKEDGCLTIKSPYIKDPAGFKTGDLVDIHEDGRFLLKGRADSIVKIEEKRISLTEVENRLTQSGLVKDVCVVAMNDRRQYLAAAIVFNSEGQEKFKDMKKFDINMYFHNYLIKFFENVVLPKKWRYLEAIPSDLQGKHKKLEIRALFTKNEEDDKIKE